MLKMIKSVFILAFLTGLTGCAVNPATGENQFTALMPAGQESSIGASEHQKIMAQYGGTVKDTNLTNYVSRVGARVAANTERSDVNYQFFLLDTPVVNAFALPGGYVYTTRGILAIAENEAQLAAVLAHEIGHVTARHSAERYSHGVVTTLGAAVLAAALDSNAASQAASLGSQLYLTSYSRKQESQADDLGIRYLSRAGYDPSAMSAFLANLERFTKFEAEESGKSGENYSYFSTHPQTADRVVQARSVASNYPKTPADTNKGPYLSAVGGMVFGDSADQGFVRNNTIWHPGMNFTFSVPEEYDVANNPNDVVAKDKASGTVILFDAAPAPQGVGPAQYLTQVWMKGEPVSNVEEIDVNGRRAATGEFSGTINKRPVTVRMVAVQWNAKTMFRFQMAIPTGIGQGTIDGLKRTTYSLRDMTSQERDTIRPYRIKIVTANAGDTVSSLSRMQPYKTMNEQRFRAINGLSPAENVTVGQPYKVVVE